MNNLQKTFSFNHHEMTVIQDAEGEPWFVAKDVCDLLGISNSRDALSLLDRDEKNTVVLTDGKRGNPNRAIVNESGLYSIIINSRKPASKTFRKWITSEVLPQIRKTGSYTPEPRDKMRILAEAVLLANDELQKAQPKIEFYDRVAESSGTHSMSEVAKVLKLPYGRNKLYRELRDRGVLMRNNEPYQQYIDRGYFEVKLSEYKRGEETYTSTTTIVTGSGLEWLAKKLEV